MKPMDENIDVLNKVERWFADQCDGDWEHSHGISIETLDNPGWYVEISILETEWAETLIPLVNMERSDSNWFRFEVSQGKFTASGGISNLGEILSKFLSIVGEDN